MASSGQSIKLKIEAFAWFLFAYFMQYSENWWEACGVSSIFVKTRSLFSVREWPEFIKFFGNRFVDRLTCTAHHIKRMFAPYFFRYSNRITTCFPGAD